MIVHHTHNLIQQKGGKGEWLYFKHDLESQQSLIKVHGHLDYQIESERQIFHAIYAPIPLARGGWEYLASSYAGD